MKELADRAQVNSIRRRPAATESDPVAEALHTARQVTAQKILDRNVESLDLETARSRKERLELELETKELESRSRSGGGDGDMTAVGILMNQVNALQEQVAIQQQAMYSQEIAVLEDKLAVLQQQVVSARDHGPTGISQVTALREQLEEYRGLLETISGWQTPPPITGESESLSAWKVRADLDRKRMDLEHEREAWKREDAQFIALKEVELKRQRDQEELSIMREHNQKMDRLIDETLPKILGHVQNFANAFMANRQQQPEASPQMQPPTLPPDVVPFSCVRCGQQLYYRQGWPGVICSTCGMVYESEGEDTEAASTVDVAEEASEEDEITTNI